MAYTMSDLKAKIKSNLQSKFGTPSDATVLDKAAEAIAQACADEILLAVVNSTGPDAQGGIVTSIGTVS